MILQSIRRLRLALFAQWGFSCSTDVMTNLHRVVQVTEFMKDRVNHDSDWEEAAWAKLLNSNQDILVLMGRLHERNLITQVRCTLPFNCAAHHDIAAHMALAHWPHCNCRHCARRHYQAHVPSSCCAHVAGHDKHGHAA